MSRINVDEVESDGHATQPPSESIPNEGDVTELQSEVEEIDPGSTIIWVGKFSGQRLDGVPAWYTLWALKQAAVPNPTVTVRSTIYISSRISILADRLT